MAGKDLVALPDPFPTTKPLSPEELGRREGVPVIPPLKWLPPVGPNPTVAICGACGLEIKQVMGYVCSRNDCPCFPRITCA